MKPTDAKRKIHDHVEANKEMLGAMNDFIHDNPELGNEEFKAHQLITETLAANGFSVDKEVLEIKTAFRAVYKIGAGTGPNIGLLCEYDALQGLGHGCGHNMQGPAIVGAALALTNALRDCSATITVFGTPAEETTSAKLPMVKAGVFDELDVALMMHGGDRTTVDGKSLAVNMIDFVFKGKAAHAAIAPEKGISALDAVLMTFNGMEYLREHVRSDVRFHGIITDGGKAPNIVPERAAAQFWIRASDRECLDAVVERVCNVARGAALATGAELTINTLTEMDNKLNVDALNSLLLTEASRAGAENITPPRKLTGSTDFASVTHRVPGACLRVYFVPYETSSHTKEWVDAGKSVAAHKAVQVAAKAIACACYDLITRPDLLQEIKAEFHAAKNPTAVSQS